MSEIYPRPRTGEDEAGHVLFLLDLGDSKYRFRIDSLTRPADLFATLAHLTPDLITINHELERILEQIVTSTGSNILRNQRFMFRAPDSKPTPNSRIETVITFGEAPTIEDVRVCFLQAFGDTETVRLAMRQLLFKLIDDGKVDRFDVFIRDIAANGTNGDTLAEEMLELTRDYYDK